MQVSASSCVHCGKIPHGINRGEDLGKVSRLVRDVKPFGAHRDKTFSFPHNNKDADTPSLEDTDHHQPLSHRKVIHLCNFFSMFLACFETRVTKTYRYHCLLVSWSTGTHLPHSEATEPKSLSVKGMNLHQCRTTMATLAWLVLNGITLGIILPKPKHASCAKGWNNNGSGELQKAAIEFFIERKRGKKKSSSQSWIKIVSSIGKKQKWQGRERGLWKWQQPIYKNNL